MSTAKHANDILILIPARSGSTRVKNKNIRVLGDRPLLGHAVAAGLESGQGRVIVSTNDPEIAAVAKAQGAQAPFLRPAELSTAKSSSRWVILHALQWLDQNEGWRPELVAYCPPTNPFIRPETIRGMAEILSKRTDVNSIVTVTKPKTHPFRILARMADGRMQNGIVRLEGKTVNDVEMTQDWPEVWEGSPACRMTWTKYFWALLDTGRPLTDFPGSTYDSQNCLGFEVDAIEASDIDGEDDWNMAEAFYRSFRQPSGSRS